MWTSFLGDFAGDFASDFAGIGAEKYALYLAAEFVMVIAPGTAIMYAVNRGLKFGFIASTAATVGVLLVNTLYFVLSALGLSALILQFPIAFRLLQLTGAAYLLFLAWQSWTAQPTALSLSTPMPVQPYASVLWQSIKLQLANIKAIMTFIAIVPPFVNPNTAVAPQMVWLAAGSLIPEMLVLFACGAIAARLGFLLQSPTVLRRIERACAVLLASVAAMIVFYA